MFVTLINTNRMLPPIAPIGLDYVAGAVSRTGVDVELLDLALADDPAAELARYFARRQPELIGVSFRNVDDCFWPSAQSFLPSLRTVIADIRQQTEAPIVLGGVGYSLFPRAIIEATGADFGIHGDGEQATGALLGQLGGRRQWDRVPGLVYRDTGLLRSNAPAWPEDLSVPVDRGFVDNPEYFRRGGQIGVETKRGCSRRCIYCADPLAKGRSYRLRDPVEVAGEIQALLGQGVEMLHLCDAEFNLPPSHARQVCDELIRRGLGRRVKWYAYLAVVPFSQDLARRMGEAGCAGINFTSDSADPRMLRTYGQLHRREDLLEAVRVCRRHGITVMLDLLLGGPGETPETVAETIRAVRQIDPDCAGAALGIRIYPGTPMAAMVRSEGPMETNPNVRRRYPGPVDLLRPTFYVSAALGSAPGRLVSELIGGDSRFFAPQPQPDLETDRETGDHNYNQNEQLIQAIRAGARGAYWDILRQLRST